jgi:LacI family transcriptional regulator
MKKRSSQRRPLVAIAVDSFTTYGRAIIRGIMRYANLQRTWLIHEEFRPVYSAVKNWPRSDGTIAAGVTTETAVVLRRKTKHIVMCSGSADPKKSPVVCLDDIAAGAMAANHLLDCRLEHFGYYGPTDTATPINRIAGFRQVLNARGFDCSISPTYWETDAGRIRHRHWPAVIKWLKELPKPAGILTFDDYSAFDLAAVALGGGIDVPDDVAIIGVNNDDLLCESAWPQLSSIEADWSRMGFAAAKILDGMMTGRQPFVSPTKISLPPLGVVKRLSTDVLAVDDPNLSDAVRFIREHACDPCTVQDVLRQVPVSRRNLERQFVSKLGRTPHDEIMHVRMESAKRLLQRLDLSLPDVAYKCGFSAASNFSRAFVQTQGMTPAAFRRSATLRGK